VVPQSYDYGAPALAGWVDEAECTGLGARVDVHLRHLSPAPLTHILQGHLSGVAIMPVKEAKPWDGAPLQPR
jgi:hypothetical protein